MFLYFYLEQGRANFLPHLTLHKDQLPHIFQIHKKQTFCDHFPPLLSICHDLKITDRQHNNDTDNNDNINSSNNKVNRLDLWLEKLGYHQDRIAAENKNSKEDVSKLKENE